MSFSGLLVNGPERRAEETTEESTCQTRWHITHAAFLHKGESKREGPQKAVFALQLGTKAVHLLLLPGVERGRGGQVGTSGTGTLATNNMFPEGFLNVPKITSTSVTRCESTVC